MIAPLDSAYYLGFQQQMPGMNDIGIERLCLFGMPPVEHVALAADLGCTCIGIGLTAMRYFNPDNYPGWSLRDDPALRQEMIAVMRDRGVRISLCEGFGIAPGRGADDYARDLDIAQELGAERINAVSTDRDEQRTLDGLARITEMASERGIEVVTEVGMGPLARLAEALAAVRQVGGTFRLLIDTMHYFRLGGSMEEISAIDPKLIGYVQLCDAPLKSPFSSYMEEALYERMTPGTGELPLREFLALVPSEVVISVEVPQRSLAEAGMTARQRAGRCVEAARAILSENLSLARAV
jgi:sugar phosphate isomerase/epimerase